MDLSFVILTWNSGAYISRCLDSIFSSLDTAGLSYEILIVDNGSKDDSPRILKEYEKKNPGVLVPIFLRENVGTTVSRNMALRLARGAYLCVMDSDVEFRSGVLPVLMDVLEADLRVGMVVPKILYPSGNWQKSTDRFPTLVHKVNRFFRLRQIEAAESIGTVGEVERREVDYAISAFWLLRREVMEMVGLLDERIFYAPEDVDYCLRIWKAGYQIKYVPSVSIIHHAQEISRGFEINMAKINHFKGLMYLYKKHSFLFKTPIVKTM
jgi:GT2 family glycosyltransferase